VLVAQGARVIDRVEVDAARGWSLSQTADVFLVTVVTISSWMKRLDESGSELPMIRPASRLKCVAEATSNVKLTSLRAGRPMRWRVR
jgi:transposase